MTLPLLQQLPRPLPAPPALHFVVKAGWLLQKEKKAHPTIKLKHSLPSLCSSSSPFFAFNGLILFSFFKKQILN